MSNKLAEIGKTYYVEDGKFWMIGTCLSETEVDGGYKRSMAKAINSIQEFKPDNRWCYESKGRHFREATDDEIAWLNACINAGKYVGKPIYNTSIFN